MSTSLLPAYVEQGQGDTALVLLHGVGGGRAAFSATLPVLAQAGYRALAWDAPGYGGSALATSGEQPLTMTGMAQALLRLVRHIGAKRTVVLGHSMGGMIAQEAFFLQPDAFDGLVLFATSPAFGKPGGDWQRAFLQSRFAALDAGMGMAGLAPGLVDDMVAQDASVPAQAAAVALMSAVPEPTYRAALAAIVAFNRLDNLPRINLPVLCLACDEDKTAPPAVMEKMASKIPQGHYQCLAHAGHLGNMEQPDAFNAALLGFLRQHFPPKE